MNIVGFGLIATLVIAVLIILVAEKKSEASQLVLIGILPLVGKHLTHGRARYKTELIQFCFAAEVLV